MTLKISYYRIYLLTVWQEPAAAAPDDESASAQNEGVPSDTGWRFALEDPRTGQRRGFVNAVDLVALLLTDLHGGEPSADDPSLPPSEEARLEQ